MSPCACSTMSHHSACAAGAPLHAPSHGVLDPGDGPRAWTMPCAWALAGVGAVAGVLSGLLGVGGGFVVVPSLTRLTNLTSQSILATSLAVIALVSVGSITAAAVQGSIAWDIAFPFTVGAVIAMLAGRMIAARLTGARLQQAFALTSGAVSLLLLARGLGWITSGEEDHEPSSADASARPHQRIVSGRRHGLQVHSTDKKALNVQDHATRSLFRHDLPVGRPGARCRQSGTARTLRHAASSRGQRAHPADRRRLRSRHGHRDAGDPGARQDDAGHARPLQDRRHASPTSSGRSDCRST